MSEAEGVVAVAFGFSMLICWLTLREARADPHRVRLFLLGNAALGMLIWLANSATSLRGALFQLVLAIGATEAGYWAALAIDKLLPLAPTAEQGKPWGWRNDKPGCAVAVVVAIGMLAALGMMPGEE